jgi:hypothetical protein
LFFTWKYEKSMKTKAIIVVVFCAFLCFIAEAQSEKKPIINDTSRNEIFAGYGVLTSMDMAVSMVYLISLPFFWGVEVYEPHYSGAFFMGYQNKVSDRVRLSGTFAYEKIRLEGLTTNYTSTGNCYAVLGGVKFRYNKITGKVDLYGRFDLGIMFFNNAELGVDRPADTYTPSVVAFQISPIGVRFGKQIGGFLEFGYGNLGLINFGIDCRF